MENNFDNIVYENKWLPIKCFDIMPNIYEICSDGQIRYIENKVLLNSIPRFGGYLSVTLKNINDLYNTYYIHRIVSATFLVGKKINQNIVNHKNLDKLNNNISNLEWVTSSENSLHSVYNNSRKLVDYEVIPAYLGTDEYRSCENNVTSKFKNEQIHEICKLMEQGIPYPIILQSLDIEVSEQNLNILTKIRCRKLWNGISVQYNIPNKEYRSDFIIYTEMEIRKICKLLEQGLDNKEISNIMNIDTSNYKSYDKFRHFIKRIKERKSYTEISKNYKW